jgi:hypothetical protein
MNFNINSYGEKELYNLYTNGIFINSDFIPEVIIQNIISETLPSSIILHSYTNIHFVVKCKVLDIFKINISNWKYNRPPDITRCNEIASYIYNRKSIMDSMIYLLFNHKRKIYEIYDGSHRLTALNIIKNNNTLFINKDTNEVKLNETISWLFESYIILNIKFNCTDSDIIESFKTLNKSFPVPDIYIRDETTERKKTIEDIVIKWQNKYNSHFVSSIRPYRPNINRDTFIELLDYIYDKYKVGETERDLSQILDTANYNISMNISSKIKLTQQIIEKCSSTGCWIFIYSIEELKKKI